MRFIEWDTHLPAKIKVKLNEMKCVTGGGSKLPCVTGGGSKFLYTGTTHYLYLPNNKGPHYFSQTFPRGTFLRQNCPETSRFLFLVETVMCVFPHEPNLPFVIFCPVNIRLGIHSYSSKYPSFLLFPLLFLFTVSFFHHSNANYAAAEVATANEVFHESFTNKKARSKKPIRYILRNIPNKTLHCLNATHKKPIIHKASPVEW
jgi:hypothetical protein